MDTDIISYETMLAAQVSTNWTFWAMVGTWFSGLVTLFAAFVALKALGIWELQEKRLERKAIKHALLNYRNLAFILPPKIDPYSPDLFRDIVLASHNAMNQVWNSVIAMEDEHLIEDVFQELFEIHGKYIRGEAEHSQVMEVLFVLLAMPLVNRDK